MRVETPALSRGTLDRHAPERSDEAWLDAAWPGARLLVVSERGEASVRYGSLGYDTTSGDRPADALYLGADSDGHVWAVRGEPAGRLADLRAAGADLDARDTGVFVHAVGLLNWHAVTTHCSRCGAPTTVTHGGSERVCPVDGSHHFPRTDPAVIMLVTDEAGERCLLGRQPSWPPGRYSCLAGFVEPGESLEMAVVREVHEESGVACHDVTYAASQPWPFPCSLMVGFYAVADPAAPMAARDGELEDARWFDRAAVAAGEVLLPPPVSIAYRMITDWANR